MRGGGGGGGEGVKGQGEEERGGGGKGVGWGRALHRQTAAPLLARRRFCVFKKLHRCAFALLNNQEVGESIDRLGHGAGALKPPHAERNCIGFRETAFQKGGEKRKEMKDKKRS